MAEDVKHEILNIVEKQSEPISVSTLAKYVREAFLLEANKLGKQPPSYPTVLKWVDVLYAEGKIGVKDYGNIKLVEKVVVDVE